MPIKTDVVKRLRLESIPVDLPIRLHSIEDLIAKDNLLTEIENDTKEEIKKIRHDIYELQSALDYLTDSQERVKTNRITIRDAIVEYVKRDLSEKDDSWDASLELENGD